MPHQTNTVIELRLLYLRALNVRTVLFQCSHRSDTCLRRSPISSGIIIIIILPKTNLARFHLWCINDVNNAISCQSVVYETNELFNINDVFCFAVSISKAEVQKGHPRAPHMFDETLYRVNKLFVRSIIKKQRTGINIVF